MELKPCPFCGSKALLEELGDHHGEYYNLGCANEKCPAHHIFYTFDPTEDPKSKIIDLWNTRQPPDLAEIEGRIDEFEQAVTVFMNTIRHHYPREDVNEAEAHVMQAKAALLKARGVE